MKPLATGGVTLNSMAPENENDIIYKINLYACLHPEQLKKRFWKDEVDSEKVHWLKSSQQQSVKQSDVEIASSSFINSQSESQEEHHQESEHSVELDFIPPDATNMATSMWWGLKKSVVLGGLNESITSLVIITSAARANISDGNIVALALTNLIAGFFIIRNNLQGHEKNERKKKGHVENETEMEMEQSSRYKEMLGDIRHYMLHYIVAILSFVIFGLVPPLVYAFSFPNNGNKNLKIIAAAGASLSCTTFLAIGKAHIQKPSNWLVYAKTGASYVSIGIVAFGFSYIAGDIFANLAEEVHWFD